MTTSPRSALQAGRPGVLATTAMTTTLVAAAGIIAALCLGLASPAGVATAALADVLACVAFILAVASYTTPCPGRPHLSSTTSQPGRHPAQRPRRTDSWELDTLDDLTWQRWEHQVFGWPAQDDDRGTE